MCVACVCGGGGGVCVGGGCVYMCGGGRVCVFDTTVFDLICFPNIRIALKLDDKKFFYSKEAKKILGNSKEFSGNSRGILRE